MIRLIPLLALLMLVGCSRKTGFMTVIEVEETNGGSSFLGNDGGVWNYIATDGVHELRSYHHAITKVGDKICCAFVKDLLGKNLFEVDMDQCE